MADKKQEDIKVVLERTYNVPLRKEWLKSPRHKRTNKAVKALREFLQKHMKSEDIKLGSRVNELLWKHGIKNPPHHVKVNAKKDELGIVRAELEGFEFKEAVKSKAKEEKSTGLKGKLQDALGKTGLKEEESKDEVKEEKEESKTEVEKTSETKPKKSPAKKKPATKKKPAAKKKTTTSKSTKKSSKK